MIAAMTAGFLSRIEFALASEGATRASNRPADSSGLRPFGMTEIYGVAR
jgi:hypothetical protein